MLIALAVGAAASVDAFATGVFVGRKWAKRKFAKASSVSEAVCVQDDNRCSDVPEVTCEPAVVCLPDYTAMSTAGGAAAAKVDKVSIAQARIDAAAKLRPLGR